MAMQDLVIDDRYVIKKDIKAILDKLQSEVGDKKLKDIRYAGDGVNVTCPNSKHKGGRESTASCYVYIGDDPNIYWGTCHCFGCEFKGSLATFVGACFDKDEKFGKEWLIKNFLDKVIEKPNNLQLNTLKLETAVIEKPTYLNEQILDDFQSWHPYLAQRNLNKLVCDKFQVKYDPNTKSIVFPVRDVLNNSLLFLTRRNINDKKFIIDPNSSKALYLLNEVIKRKYKFTFVTEGQIDALSCWGFGYPCIATMGAPSKIQATILNGTDLNVVILMFDNDEAGKKFAQKFKSWISNKFIVYNIRWNVNKGDINDLTKEEFDNILSFNGLDSLIERGGVI